MSNEYFTIASASSLGFWENQLKINKKPPFEITFIATNEISIWSENRTPLEYIVNLSKEYPNEIFRFKIVGEDVYENYVSLYECISGDCKLVKEGYEYIFTVDRNIINKIGEDDFKKFEKKAVSLFNRTELSKEKIHYHLYFDENENEFQEDIEGLSVMVKYRTKDAWLIAKLQGLTHILVDIEFFDKKEKLLSPKSESRNDTNELPI